MLSAEKGTLNEILPYKNLSPVQTDATCWLTTPKIVGSYMYVAHVCTLLHVVTCYFVLLGVAASVCTPLLTRTQQLQTLLSRFTLL